MPGMETTHAAHADISDIYTTATHWLENTACIKVSEAARFVGQLEGLAVVEDHATPPVQFTTAFRKEMIDTVVPQARMLEDYRILGLCYVPHYFYLGSDGPEYAAPFLHIQMHNFDDETNKVTCDSIRFSPKPTTDTPHYIDTIRQRVPSKDTSKATEEQHKNFNPHLLRPSEAVALRGIVHNLSTIRQVVQQFTRPRFTSWGP